MPERKLTLINRRGLHARAATKLVQCAQPFGARVIVRKGEMEADASNIMALLMLAAPCGTELIIQAEGNDADQALEAIQTLVESRFEEDA